MDCTPMDNAEIAACLRQAGEQIQARGDNPYRAAAFCRAAATVEHTRRPLAEIYGALGLGGLKWLPAIGEVIAAVIAELLVTGRSASLERLAAHEELRSREASA